MPGFRCADGLLKKAVSGAITVMKEAIQWTSETLHLSSETLVDPEDDATSAENNTSVILLLKLDGKYFLMTAMPACQRCSPPRKYAATLGIEPPTAVPLAGPAPRLTSECRADAAFLDQGTDRVHLGAARRRSETPVQESGERAESARRRLYTTCGRSLLWHSADAPTGMGQGRAALVLRPMELS